MPAEVSSNLARFDGIRYARIAKRRAEGGKLNDLYLKQKGEGFGAEAKRRIILGTFVLSSGYYDAYYEKAQRVRTLIKQRLRRGIQRSGRDPHARRADPGVQDRRKDERSPCHVSCDIFTIPREPCRTSPRSPSR